MMTVILLSGIEFSKLFGDGTIAPLVMGDKVLLQHNLGGII